VAEPKTEAVAEPKTEAVAEPKTEAVAEPKTEPIPRSVKTRAPPLSSPPTPDDPYMLKVEDVAEKIRALPKGVWKTSYEIQKALEPAPPHKTPFAPIQAINSVLYTMLGKGAVEKGVHPHDKRPIWKLV
jgi:hypothetical protein